ncbi:MULTISPECIES: lyase family protein [unclassified Microbacterium]|uniref:lyase family protein n=1 Tax=unclassified Microbacterium TaxID=2609290 RepID=UPI00214C63C6|nr:MULTISPECIES: lyase family protein [unclassified Microbacterium]MCR2783304.1 lyase family protein [Microbacterium sp. zg.B96]WIM15821.1 lyase family protein [Microbacterium sp. zg-B96]
MSSDARLPVDVGLLSPVTARYDQDTTDAAVLAALVAAEIALTRAWAQVGVASEETADAVAAALGGRDRDAAGDLPDVSWLSATELAAAARAGGNPVIPLVGALKDRAPADGRDWVHRGATSQDILDSALMLTARRAGALILADLAALEILLASFAATHRDEVAAARTLGQHAVPTTVGLRAANWLRGIARARSRLTGVLAELPAQLGGAGGTLASFLQIGGADAAAGLPAAFATELGLAAPDAPWHTTRWPVTELGDALTQVTDALGVIAADVVTGSRTEIGELAEGSGGGSSAMPQKRNPAAAVLVRSAALRAPHLSATLHTAAALAVDERPDGAWHAEWPTLREMLRLARGAAATAVDLVGGLRVDSAAVARNLAVTDGLIVAERVALVLTPVIGKAAAAELLTRAVAGEALTDLVTAATAGSDLDVTHLLDPAGYVGLAGALVDDAIARTHREEHP